MNQFMQEASDAFSRRFQLQRPQSERPQSASVSLLRPLALPVHNRHQVQSRPLTASSSVGQLDRSSCEAVPLKRRPLTASSAGRIVSNDDLSNSPWGGTKRQTTGGRFRCDDHAARTTSAARSWRKIADHRGELSKLIAKEVSAQEVLSEATMPTLLTSMSPNRAKSLTKPPLGPPMRDEYAADNSTEHNLPQLEQHGDDCTLLRRSKSKDELGGCLLLPGFRRTSPKSTCGNRKNSKPISWPSHPTIEECQEVAKAEVGEQPEAFILEGIDHGYVPALQRRPCLRDSTCIQPANLASVQKQSGKPAPQDPPASHRSASSTSSSSSSSSSSSGLSSTSSNHGRKALPRGTLLAQFGDRSRNNSDSSGGRKAREQYARGSMPVFRRASLRRASIAELVFDADAFRAKRCQPIFERLQDDGMIHRDMLFRALELLDFGAMNLDHIYTVLAEVTKYYTMDSEEFVRFVKSYEEFEHAQCMRLFHELDSDGNGTVDVDELGALLPKCGIIPMNQVLHALIAEACDTSTGHVHLNFNDFRQLITVLRATEGFTHDDVEAIRHVFARYQKCEPDDRGPQMSVSDLPSALRWMGRSVDGCAEMSALVNEMNLNNCGSLNKYEFLSFMRRVREFEIESVFQVLELPHVDVNLSVVSTDDLPRIVNRLGYVPDSNALEEVAEEVDSTLISLAGTAGILLTSRKKDDMVSMAWIWEFLKTYRDREGLRRDEVAFLNETFQSYAGDSGQLDRTVAAQAIRWLGYAIAWQARLKILSDIDIDSSGTLCQAEMRKVARKLREHEISRLQRVFQQHAQAGGGGTAPPVGASPVGVITEGRCALALQSYGFRFSDALEVVKGKGSLQFDRFVQIALFSECATKKRENFRRCRCFTEAELKELRGVFDRYDKDRSGDIAKDELRMLLQELMPAVASTMDRTALLDLLKTIDENSDGALGFSEFTNLCAALREKREEELTNQEKRAMHSGSFSAKEVDCLRGHFLEAGGDEELPISFGTIICIVNGGIRQADFESMLTRASVVTREQRKNLASAFTKLALEKRSALPLSLQPKAVRRWGLKDTDFGREMGLRAFASSYTVDFPDFLRILRTVINAEVQVKDTDGISSSGQASGVVQVPPAR